MATVRAMQAAETSGADTSGADTSGAETPGPAATTAVVSRTAFRRVWAAAAVSNLGDGIGLTALPLLVASQTNDPLLVGAAAAALQLPWLLFALPSGAIADRLDRRVAMISMDLLRVAVVGVLVLAVLAGQAPIALVCLVSFGLSTAETIFDPSSEAMLPHLVEPGELAAANARLQGTSIALNNFVGPPIGAALFTIMVAAPFGLDALSFAASAVLILSVAGSYRRPRGVLQQSLIGETLAGLRWLSRHPVLRVTSPLAGILNIAGYAIFATLVLFSRDVLRLDDLGFGLLLGGFGLGGLVGAATAGRVIGALGDAGALRLSPWLLVATSVVVVGLPVPIVAAGSLALAGYAVGLWNVAHVTLRQHLVPDELRGRVAGTNNLVTSGARPIGAAIGTVAASLLGLSAPFAVAAIVLAVAALIAGPRITARAIEEARAVAGVERRRRP